jgi:hypothetical protein
MTSVASDTSLTRLTGRPKERVARGIAAEPIVGKDVLELLSSSMYVDPRAIYREYIQNAADSIDEAFDNGFFRGEDLGRVEVTLDPSARTVIIRDDGIGVGSADAERVLTSLGASAKRGTKARGFRGVGRLAAFGYAQTVSFRTKARGDTHSTEVRWDCKKLKSALRDPKYQGDLRQVIRDVVTVVSERESNKDLHFFEVRLEHVIRIKNDVLLNADEVERYLGEVAPAPFRSDFRHGPKVIKVISPYIAPCRFRIYVNGAKRYVTRPHKTHFAVSQTKADVVAGIDQKTLKDSSGAIQAILWIAHHGYQGALHGVPEFRGLRARVGDIQVGDDQVFYGHFPEPRFNSWTIAELHIVDRRIIPNGRRDGFEQNEAYADLLSQLVPIMREIGSRCRKTSTIRNRVRGFERSADRLRKLFASLSQRGVSPRREARLRSEIAATMIDMKKIITSKGLPDGSRLRLKRRLSALKTDYAGLAILRDDVPPFSAFPIAQRLIYQEVIDLIHEVAPQKSGAQSLVDRLVARIEAQALTGRMRKKRR